MNQQQKTANTPGTIGETANVQTPEGGRAGNPTATATAAAAASPEVRNQYGLIVHEVFQWVNTYIQDAGPIEMTLEQGREVKVLEALQDSGGLRLAVTGIESAKDKQLVEFREAYVPKLLDAIFAR